MEDPTEKEIKAALRLAVQALKDYRRRNFAIGHNAFIKGQIFIFTEKDHVHYMKYTAAIDTLDVLINKPKIMKDTGDKE
jgi:hypothetical protein